MLYNLPCFLRKLHSTGGAGLLAAAASLPPRPGPKINNQLIKSSFQTSDLSRFYSN